MKLALAALLALGLSTAAPALAGDLVAVTPHPIALTVQDRDGHDRDFAAVSGRLTLVHFWASWCGSCRTEFPAIDAFQRDLAGKGVKVAAVSLDRMGWPVIDRTVETLGIRDVALFHDGDRKAARDLGVVGLPTTLVVDENGREVARVVGAGAWDDPAFRDRVMAATGH